MATLTLRVEDAVRQDLETVARGRGVTVSDLLRSAISGLLGRDEPGSESTPLALTLLERRQLVLQHEILASLHQEDQHQVDDHRRAIDVLANGYAGEYHRLFSGISPELSRRKCALVVAILDMFRVLRASMRRLAVDDRAALDDHTEAVLTFGGFDFNDELEVRLAGYAEHLIATGRWQELSEHFDDQHERGNSHMPMLANYLRMLEAFQPLWDSRLHDHTLAHDDRYVLNADELRTLVEAAEPGGPPNPQT